MADDDDSSDNGTHPVIEVLDKFFAEQEPEKWCIRRPWDLQEEEEAPSNREPKQAKSSPFPLEMLNKVSTESWLQIASFLDPHDIDCLALSCQACHVALKYPNGWTEIADTLPALRVRLESIFRYFRILKLYADQIQKLKYKWVDIIKLLTQVAHEMQRKYGQTFEVHPIHRALVAECILERLCNNEADKFEMSQRLPILEGYGCNNSGDFQQHFRPTAAKVSLSELSTSGSNTNRLNTKYGDGNLWVSMGDPLQLRNTSDPDNFLQTWLHYASTKHWTNAKYSFAERQAIAEKRCPVVWLFDWSLDPQCPFEVGISVSDGTWQTQFHFWQIYYKEEFVDIARFWGDGLPDLLTGIEIDRIQGVAEYLLLFPGVYEYEERLGPGQVLFRLAWLYAHQISPMFVTASPHNIFEDWEATIASIEEEDDEMQGYGIPLDVIHANVRAIMVAKTVGLAQASDYSLV